MHDAKVMLDMVFEDCRAYLNSYFDNGIMAGAVFALGYCFTLLYKFKYRQKKIYQALLEGCIRIPFAALLGFYGYLVLATTILSRSKGTEYILRGIPFTTWGTDPLHLLLWVENIVMMVPLGILLYILWKPFRKIGWSILVGGLFSLMIECVQLFMRLGKFETDDIMNNVFGMLIGFLCCKGIHVLVTSRISYNKD